MRAGAGIGKGFNKYIVINEIPLLLVSEAYRVRYRAEDLAQQASLSCTPALHYLQFCFNLKP